MRFIGGIVAWRLLIACQKFFAFVSISVSFFGCETGRDGRWLPGREEAPSMIDNGKSWR